MEDLYYEDVLEALVRYLDRVKKALIEDPITMKAEKDGITVEAGV